MKTIILAILLSSSVCFANRESGGWGNFDSLYSCTEKNAANSENPKLAFLTEFPHGGIQLIVRPSQRTPNAPEFIFSGDVVRNKSIQCLVECEIYQTQEGENIFGLTKIDNTYEATFEYQGTTLSFECKPGQ